jgi:hypothetical protein
MAEFFQQNIMQILSSNSRLAFDTPELKQPCFLYWHKIGERRIKSAYFPGVPDNIQAVSSWN